MPDPGNSDDLFDWASHGKRQTEGLAGTRKKRYTFADTMFPEASIDNIARPSLKIFIPLLIFGMAMAFLESAVVVYLRQIWNVTELFPIKDLLEQTRHLKTLRVEYIREAATIVMLISISCSLGRNIWQKMAYFLFLFGVWDIFYYVWLYVIIDWPATLLMWDVLFFVPVLMVSPVYAPCAVSGIIIFCGMMIIHAQKKQVTLKSTSRFWIMEAIAFTLIYISFIWEPLFGTLKINPDALESELQYPWLMFVLGLTIGLTAFLFLIGNCFKSKGFDFDLYVSRKI